MQCPLSNDIFFINIFHFIAYLLVLKYMCIFYQQHFIYSRIFFILWNNFICYSSIALQNLVWDHLMWWYIPWHQTPTSPTRGRRRTCTTSVCRDYDSRQYLTKNTTVISRRATLINVHWEWVKMYAIAYFQILQILLLVLCFNTVQTKITLRGSIHNPTDFNLHMSEKEVIFLQFENSCKLTMTTI